MIVNARSLIIALTSSTAILSAPAANAALLSQDYASFGDGLITLDTQTGLRWLDLSATRNLSVNQILSGAGGWISNFRYATYDELSLLFAHSGLVEGGGYQTASYSAARQFVSLFNTANTACDGFNGITDGWACGIHLNGSNVDVLNVGFTSVGEGFSDHWNVGWDANFQHGSYGSILVANPVPEPETYAMMLAGLGFLGVMARRRKQKLNA